MLILPIGVSGSGKSTWARQFARENDFIYLSSDKLRAVIGKDEGDQTVSRQVFQTLEYMVEFFLKDGKTVIVDATNYNRKNRKEFIRIARACGAYIDAYYFNVPISTAKERNKQRNRVVPEFVIDRQANGMEIPDLNEVDRLGYIDENGSIMSQVHLVKI